MLPYELVQDILYNRDIYLAYHNDRVLGIFHTLNDSKLAVLRHSFETIKLHNYNPHMRFEQINKMYGFYKTEWMDLWTETYELLYKIEVWNQNMLGKSKEVLYFNIDKYLKEQTRQLGSVQPVLLEWKDHKQELMECFDSKRKFFETQDLAQDWVEKYPCSSN